jgi:hypothetical protein
MGITVRSGCVTELRISRAVAQLHRRIVIRNSVRLRGGAERSEAKRRNLTKTYDDKIHL